MIPTIGKPVTPSPRRSAGRWLRHQAVWGLVDQAISSVTNFGISLLVARETEPGEFGTFSVAIALYLFLLWASRSLCTEPLAVRYAAAPEPDQLSAGRQAAGAALLAGVGAGCFVFTVGVILGPMPPRVLGVMALSMPGLLTQDAMRYVFFTTRRSRSAVANDLVWAIVQFGISGALVATGEATAVTLTAAFGGAASFAAIVACLQARLMPFPGGALAWFKSNRHLSVPFLLEITLVAGMLQITMVAIAAVVGIVAVGEIRAAMLLFGPWTVIFMGIFVAGVPAASRLRAQSPASLSRLVVTLGIGMPAIVVAWTAILLLTPSSLGRAALSANWAPARELLVPVGVLAAANGCALAGVIGLRALTAARASLYARMRVAPVVLIGGIGGAAAGGAAGAAVGLAVAAWLDAAVVWTVLRHAGAEARRSPTSDTDVSPSRPHRPRYARRS